MVEQVRAAIQREAFKGGWIPNDFLASEVARAAIIAVQDIVGETLMQTCGGACAGAFEGIIDEALKP